MKSVFFMPCGQTVCLRREGIAKQWMVCRFGGDVRFLPGECEMRVGDVAFSWKLARGNWIEEDEIANIPSFKDYPVFLPKPDGKENKKPQGNEITLRLFCQTESLIKL